MGQEMRSDIAPMMVMVPERLNAENLSTRMNMDNAPTTMTKNCMTMNNAWTVRMKGMILVSPSCLMIIQKRGKIADGNNVTQ